MHNVDNAEGTTAHCSKQRQASHAPQDEFEVKVVRDVRAVIGFTDCHGEYSIRNHPYHNHVCTDSAIVVLLLSGFADAVLGDLESVPEIAQGFVVAGVDVQLLAGHFQLDGVAFAAHSRAEIDVDDIVTFGTPADIVRVAEGIHLQCADVRG